MKALLAALMLAIGREDGVAAIPNTGAAARRGFLALAACLPPMVALRLMEWGQGWPEHAWHEAGLTLLAYLVGWLGFAVLSWHLAGLMGAQARWPRFIALWSWCNLVQYGLVLAAGLPDWFGAPAWAGRVPDLVAEFWSIWLEWMAARLALALPRLPAAGFVAADILLGLLLAGVTDQLG